MPPIDPRLVKAKRFPVHAAVTLCAMDEVKRLLEEDAKFHLPRKMPDTELSVVHSACTERPYMDKVLAVEILKFLVSVNAPLDDLDNVGQSPLHYAVCSSLANDLVPLLIQGGCKVDVQRKFDLWTPLHLAALLGKTEVVRLLVITGNANVSLSDACGLTALRIAERYRKMAIADFLACPRQRYEPKDPILPEMFDDLITKVEQRKLEDTAIKIKEELIAWRDENNNSVLHIAAWNGDIHLARALFDSVKGRKLLGVTNSDGASPLAMAILGGQTKLVQEFFMHKHSKKLLDLSSTLNATGENIVHLMFRYTPFIHPKFILKRKDLTKETLNAKDSNGLTPLLDLAMRGRHSQITKILLNKAIRDNKLLDLGVKTEDGRTIFHHLLMNDDIINFKLLLSRDELATETLSQSGGDGKNVLEMCLDHKWYLVLLQGILENPQVTSKFSFDSAKKQSFLHLLAEIGNVELWKTALHNEHCDINVPDADGNTPLMKVLCCGRYQMAQVCLADKVLASSLNFAVRNSESNTLLMLCIQHMDGHLVDLLLKQPKAMASLNETNADGNTALHLAAQVGKWTIVQKLLESDELWTSEEKTEDAGHREIFDIHKKNNQGYTCLVLIVLARLKLEKLEHSYLLKKEKTLAQNVKKESEHLWDIIKLILEREKNVHGPTMIKGRDGGKACLKKQLTASNMIKAPTWEEITSEYGRLYGLKKFSPIRPEQQNNMEESPKSPKEPNGLPSPMVKLKPVSKKKTLTEEPSEVAKAMTDEKPRKKSSSSRPTISLDDLRDPAAFEAMVNNVTSQIMKEKKKTKAKKKVYDKRMSLNLESSQPSALKDVISNDSEVERIKLEANKKEQVLNGSDEIFSKDEKEEKQQENNIDKQTEDGQTAPASSKELVPVPAPRRRTPSFKGSSSPTNERPPRPEGPSPPPPDYLDEIDDPKFKFALKVAEVMDKVIPKRNDVADFSNEYEKSWTEKPVVEFMESIANEKDDIENSLKNSATSKNAELSTVNKNEDSSFESTTISNEDEAIAESKREEIIEEEDKVIMKDTLKKKRKKVFQKRTSEQDIDTVSVASGVTRVDVATQTDDFSIQITGTQSMSTCCCNCHKKELGK